MYSRLITDGLHCLFVRLVLSQSNAEIISTSAAPAAAATRQFLLKTEFNAQETRIQSEEHMRDRLYARMPVKH